MEIVEKPDFQVFASEAKTGEVISFPDVLRGWGITLDQTQGKPPLEWMNDAFNRIDLNNLYLLQQGIPEWDKAVRYPINSIIKHAGKIYSCVAENENNEPSNNSDKWVSYVRSATTSQKGIVQLTNTIDDSEDKAITPFAVNELQKSIEQAITEATEVPVDKIFAFDTATPPAGYIARNGQAIDQATMPKLYARYGNNLPDMRDRVLRMAGELAGTAGSTQEDAMQKISGGFAIQDSDAGNKLWLSTATSSGVFKSMTNTGQTSNLMRSGNSAGTSGIEYDNSRVARTSEETRVKAQIVIFCHKIQ